MPSNFAHKTFVQKRFLFAFVVVIISLIITSTLGGFACLKNPCMHGICIDDINSTHQCYCRSGFTGFDCGVNWDECRFSPCLNGGTCIDDIDFFTCLCPENYAGAQCEIDLLACDKECYNNGTCVTDPNSGQNNTFCQCQPGYAGAQCEIDVSVCNATSNACLNGGKCIDGIGDKYFCECQQGWIGKICEINFDECFSNPCHNGGICVDQVNDFICACPFGYTGKACETKLQICEENPCLNDAFCLVEEDEPKCYCVPDYHGKLCGERYNECEPGPKCFNGGTCIDGVGDYACSCQSDFFGKNCQCSQSNQTECEDLPISTTWPFISSTSIPETSILQPSSSLIVVTTKFISDHISSLVSPYDPGGQTTQIVPGDSITLFPSPTLWISDSVVEMSTPMISLPITSESDIIKSESIFSFFSSLTEEISLTKTLSMPEKTVTLIQSDSVHQDLDGSKLITASEPLITMLISKSTDISSEIFLESSEPFTSSDRISIRTTTMELISPTLPITPIESEISSIESLLSKTDEMIITSTIVEPLMSSVISPTLSLPLITPEPTRIITSPPPEISTLPYNLTDPCQNFCHNDAKCIFTNIQPVCLCPFKFIGTKCEIAKSKIITPSFTGDSFLSYQIPLNSTNILNVTSQLATVVPEGILFYTVSQKVYALIFLQSGLVTLHFSCGSQSMHFVETRMRVDNGYNFTLNFQMQILPNGLNTFRCTGQIRVNDSYIMKGEQNLNDSDNYFNPNNDVVYLGGIDFKVKDNAERNDELIQILPGFRGCMYSLIINTQRQDMYDDAIDGRDIMECTTFACAINPCFGDSKCAPSNKPPYWTCICPTGYQGIHCHIPVCVPKNPCQNSAICTTSSNNDTTQPICLCPLRYSGSLCQHEVNITKPSFKPPSNLGYSSFITYDTPPRFSDWFQMKFHFVAYNTSQMSLLLFIGNHPIKQTQDKLSQIESPLVTSENMTKSNLIDYEVSSQVPDFFSLSFIQGFIALTWNLGSGSQRIITPSAIDNRINIHTLFAGRSGRYAWLKVDGMRNISGKAPGQFYRLNVETDLYLGGYETYNFQGLPHDLSFYKGFEGCLFDLGFRVKNRLYLPNALKGRNVKNCFDEDC